MEVGAHFMAKTFEEFFPLARFCFAGTCFCLVHLSKVKSCSKTDLLNHAMDYTP